MQRIFYSFPLVLFLLAGLCQSSLAQNETSKPKRRVFVLHAGMHILLAPEDKNHAVKILKEMLLARGIAERDIIALDCPYPQASAEDAVPRGGLLIYLESADPASRSSQAAYLRLHQALQAHGISKDDNLVWIGHSAGGQMGMTLANLAHNLAKYADLAKKTQAYHFEMVITLGAAVGANPVPAQVKLRHYYSAADSMLYFLTKQGNVISELMGSKVCFVPCFDLRANARVRVFHDIEHWQWYSEPAVLECILREFEPHPNQGWRQAQAEVGQGIGLAQLLTKALESEGRISLEDVHP